MLKANASLFIFCLRDLSIYVSGALKPPTITILLFLCLNMLIFALYFRCSYVGCLSTYKWHLLNGLTPLPSPNSQPCLLLTVLKPPLSDTRVAAPSHWHGAAFPSLYSQLVCPYSSSESPVGNLKMGLFKKYLFIYCSLGCVVSVAVTWGFHLQHRNS